MGFALNALDEHGVAAEDDEYLSYTRWAMTDLRRVIATTKLPPSSDEAEVLHALTWNEEDVVTPEQCAWLAERLANADRQRILAEEPGPDELLGLIDALREFCVRCSTRGGFIVT